MGRIWVEDQDYHIVRFNGGYSGKSKTKRPLQFRQSGAHECLERTSGSLLDL